MDAKRRGKRPSRRLPHDCRRGSQSVISRSWLAHQRRAVQDQSVGHHQIRHTVSVAHIQRPVDRHPIQRAALHNQR
jgi:hypothetical protein